MAFDSGMTWLPAFFKRAPRGNSRRRLPPFSAEPLEPRELLASGGVTYQGGPVMNNVAVETVFLGTAWASDPSLEQNAAQLDQFFGYLTNSSYMDLLGQYGTSSAGPIGPGSYVGQVNVAEDVWRRSTVSDSTIQNVLNSEIYSGTIAPPDGNRLLFVFTPPNIVVSQGGTRSNGYPTGFAGYHNSFVDSAGQLVRYAVIPDPIGNDQVAGLSSFQQQTAASSHELAEAVTDPDGTSWWDSTNNSTSGYEIGDFADLNTDVVYLNGYAVEELWSNAAAGLAAPAGATLVPIANPVLISTVPSNLSAVAASLVSSSQYDQTFITNAYERLLDRAPDASGLSYWVNQIGLGATDEQVEADLAASPEYVALHGSDDTSWVAGLYQDMLNRPASTQDLSYWLGALDAGQSRFQVALSIVASPEHEGEVIANDYQAFLGRSATAADVNYWISVLEQGASNEAVIADILSSPEYYNGAGKGQGTSTTWLDSVFQDLYQTSPTAVQLSYWLGQLE